MDEQLFPKELWGGSWRFARVAQRHRMASAGHVPRRRRSLYEHLYARILEMIETLDELRASDDC
jgi:hypothetical protein